MSLKEVPILGSVSYRRHFADLKKYDIMDFRSIPYGEDIIEKLLECGDQPLMGRGNEIELAVRMPGQQGIRFYTRREICENLPSRKFILAEATGKMWQDDNGSFNLVAPAIPKTNPAIETIPSLAPNTAARSLFNFGPIGDAWYSGWCIARMLSRII
jgi:hypothetical protein